MRYAKHHRAKTSARIIDKAAVCIRERGIESIKVAELMEAVGLTHGGFYLHFRSRKELINQAFASAMGQSVEAWHRMVDRAEAGRGLSTIVNTYLSNQHLSDLGNGCALPTLSAEVPRQDGAVKKSFLAGLEEMVSILTDQMPGSRKDAHRDALAILALMVGAISLARAVNHDGLAAEILTTGRQAALSKVVRRPLKTRSPRKKF